MIVLGRDNLHVLRVRYGGRRVADLSGVARWVAQLDTATVDSDEFAAAFDAATWKDRGGDLLALAFGPLAWLPTGTHRLALWYFPVAGDNPLPLEAENRPLVVVRRALE